MIGSMNTTVIGGKSYGKTQLIAEVMDNPYFKLYIDILEELKVEGLPLKLAMPQAKARVNHTKELIEDILKELGYMKDNEFKIGDVRLTWGLDTLETDVEEMEAVLNDTTRRATLNILGYDLNHPLRVITEIARVGTKLVERQVLEGTERLDKEWIKTVFASETAKEVSFNKRHGINEKDAGSLLDTTSAIK